ncbi:hypothetical protein AFM11_24070 [Mycolicibacterium wolinskyi]|uniref:DUF732 domain-containing protein n=1 Tax=Mycolicibacterium wolinskyi TaxID=59750 RepID=A0A132PHA0_9MYCO|nr:DUF732 domain-containing protein [Mycolicibacterium wolinskyi]KWX21715.1 hypothetical protein AFM11_24070 [Mycolicibacterium wolinskyi]
MWKFRRRGSTPVPCPYCGSPVDADETCGRCGPSKTSPGLSGWRPDPTARHEGRYYVAGRPTNRVRNGKAESTDPVGGQLLPDYVELPARSGLRYTWLGTGVATAVLVFVAAVVWVLLRADHGSPLPPEARYLSSLKDAGLTDQFNSDANAVAHGRQVCRQLEDGGPQQGLHADKIAVDAFCPDFAHGFHILETASVPGTFVLIDTAGTDAIASDGSSCEGANGYADVGPTTPVIVKSGKGEILTTTSLGEGKGGNANCTFSFTFPITEGQDRYVVCIGRRGEFIYTFEQLRSRGVQVSLGG